LNVRIRKHEYRMVPRQAQFQKQQQENGVDMCMVQREEVETARREEAARREEGRETGGENGTET